MSNKHLQSCLDFSPYVFNACGQFCWDTSTEMITHGNTFARCLKETWSLLFLIRYPYQIIWKQYWYITYESLWYHMFWKWFRYVKKTLYIISKSFWSEISKLFLYAILVSFEYIIWRKWYFILSLLFYHIVWDHILPFEITLTFHFKITLLCYLSTEFIWCRLIHPSPSTFIFQIE